MSAYQWSLDEGKYKSYFGDIWCSSKSSLPGERIIGQMEKKIFLATQCTWIKNTQWVDDIKIHIVWWQKHPHKLDTKLDTFSKQFVVMLSNVFFFSFSILDLKNALRSPFGVSHFIFFSFFLQ